MELKHKIASTLILLILDIIWIYFFMGPRYTTQIKQIQGSKMDVNKLSALMAYTLMVIGLQHFVLPKLKNDMSFTNCLNVSFVFGIILYGVYDFTCGAVFKDWNWNVAIIDVLWGGFVYFLATYSLNLL